MTMELLLINTGLSKKINIEQAITKDCCHKKRLA